MPGRRKLAPALFALVPLLPFYKACFHIITFLHLCIFRPLPLPLYYSQLFSQHSQPGLAVFSGSFYVLTFSNFDYASGKSYPTFRFAAFSRALDELFYLDDHEGREREERHDQPLKRRKVCGFEDSRERGHGDDRHL